MKGKKVVRGKRLEGTPYFISEDEKVGKGSYAEVYRAYNIDNPNQQLVVKMISIHEFDSQQSIEAELQVIRELPWHQNLVNCVRARIESQNNLYIIMEYCNQGSLEKYIEKMTLMPEQKIWEIMVQLCKGYQVLYDAHLLHRDIKPENILIHNRIFKLADFGLSKRITDHSLKENLSYAGSPLYMAPEIVDKNEGTSKIDVFSMGSVLYQLAYDGTSPFFGEKEVFTNVYEYYQKRKKVKLILKPKNKKGEPRSQQLRNLIARMLEFDHEKRISWEEIFSHPKIDIDSLKIPLSINRVISQEEQLLEELKRSLIEVRKSSAKMQPILEKDNMRQQSQQLTLQLISFQQFLQHSELRNLENQMFRLKITQLTILYCNGKINYLVRGNQKHRQFHKHIIEGLETIVIEGLLYLLRVNQIITEKISNYQGDIMKDLRKILENDRELLVEQFKREAIIFKHLELEKELDTLSQYDLRRYEGELYHVLTQYCDYPVEAKEKVVVIVSLLLDVYDSSLKLTDLVRGEKVWEKYQQMSQIETKMDEFCFSRLQTHHFHSYLLGKEHVRLQDNKLSLKRMGLLFQ